MYVKCRIEVAVTRPPGQELIALPAAALRPGNYVWAVTDVDSDKEFGKLTKRKVKVLDQTRDESSDELMVVVAYEKTGLQVGDSVVVSPLSQATEGAKNPLGIQHPGQRIRIAKHG